jgi:hypothetical protein
VPKSDKQNLEKRDETQQPQSQSQSLPPQSSSQPQSLPLQQLQLQLLPQSQPPPLPQSSQQLQSTIVLPSLQQSQPPPLPPSIPVKIFFSGKSFKRMSKILLSVETGKTTKTSQTGKTIRTRKITSFVEDLLGTNSASLSRSHLSRDHSGRGSLGGNPLGKGSLDGSHSLGGNPLSGGHPGDDGHQNPNTRIQQQSKTGDLLRMGTSGENHPNGDGHLGRDSLGNGHPNPNTRIQQPKPEAKDTLEGIQPGVEPDPEDTLEAIAEAIVIYIGNAAMSVIYTEEYPKRALRRLDRRINTILKEIKKLNPKLYRLVCYKLLYSERHLFSGIGSVKDEGRTGRIIIGRRTRTGIGTKGIGGMETGRRTGGIGGGKTGEETEGRRTGGVKGTGIGGIGEGAGITRMERTGGVKGTGGEETGGRQRIGRRIKEKPPINRPII